MQALRIVFGAVALQLGASLVSGDVSKHPPILPIDQQNGDLIDLSQFQAQKECMECQCADYMSTFSIGGTVCTTLCFTANLLTPCEPEDLVEFYKQLESMAHDDPMGTFIKRVSYDNNGNVMEMEEYILKLCTNMRARITANNCAGNIEDLVDDYGAAPTKEPTKYPTKNPTKYPTKYPTPFPTPYPTKQPTNFVPCSCKWDMCENFIPPANLKCSFPDKKVVQRYESCSNIDGPGYRVYCCNKPNC